MARRVADCKDDWSKEKITAAVKATLNAGDFSLIIAVGRITDQLKKSIEFIDSKDRAGAHTCALEMSQYAPGDVEILVPRIYGRPFIVDPDEPMTARRLLLGDLTPPSRPVPIGVLRWDMRTPARTDPAVG